ncbi:MAG: maleylpyruvate isomerase N-terminal domain-containing protein [Acidimicrobiia bacterium]|nr:maleylpyruvate isomerase N-terminal domain-containing protein [Acidimicrobiia bacterium]
MDLTPQLTETWTALVDLLAGLDDDAWRTPTPCEGWTVHDVAAHLGHVEGVAHGFDQPEPPPDFDPGAYEGFDAMTEAGVAARRDWPAARVLDEIRRASASTLDHVSHVDEEGWEQPWPSPVGTVPLHQAQEIRLADEYVHLLDLRYALGRPLDPADEPATAAAAVGRAVRLSGWGAVKGAGLTDGTRIRLEIDGPGGTLADLVVSGRRGNLVDPDDATTDRVAGPGLAYLLAVSGRAEMADAAGGLTVAGDDAVRFLSGYRLFL